MRRQLHRSLAEQRPESAPAHGIEVQTLAAAELQAGKRVVVGSDGQHGYVLADSDADGQADMLIQLAGIKASNKIAIADFVFN